MTGGFDRTRIPFRAVNRRGAPDYDPGLQRHHLLPRQLLSKRCFGRMFDLIGRNPVGFEDFRRNGLLLPASDAAAIRLGLPLHRGPHRTYNEMVIARVGRIEQLWTRRRGRAPEAALEQALMQLALLQKALRRRLLDTDARPITLNRRDPFGQPLDFSDLDAMAELLWQGTESATAALSAAT